MKKILFLLCLLPMLNACSDSNDDGDGIDCSVIDIVIPTLYVKVVDSTNTNLIENGSIDPEYIEVEGDFSNPSFRFVPEDDFSNPDLFNTLQLSIPYTTNFQYTLLLGDLEPVTIDFSAEFTESICDTTYYVPKKAVMTNVEVEIIEVSPLTYMLVIEI